MADTVDMWDVEEAAGETPSKTASKSTYDTTIDGVDGIRALFRSALSAQSLFIPGKLKKMNIFEKGALVTNLIVSFKKSTMNNIFNALFSKLNLSKESSLATMLKLAVPAAFIGGGAYLALSGATPPTTVPLTTTQAPISSPLSPIPTRPTGNTTVIAPNGTTTTTTSTTGSGATVGGVVITPRPTSGSSTNSGTPISTGNGPVISYTNPVVNVPTINPSVPVSGSTAGGSSHGVTIIPRG